MQGLPSFSDPNLLVGAEHFSDAGVYRLADGLAVVQSVDFFPPLVNDPFVFGQIAAANSMSDVYAMGGQPKTVLNIVCFPDDKLGLDVLQEILRGGAERVQAAGAVVLGGHSVRDDGIKFGLAVTGTVHPDRLITNQAAEPGDVLVLTKALGTGFVTTANRAGKCPDDVLAAACASMIALNDTASEAAVTVGARAATDITGFGLAAHALELAQASEVTVRLELSRLPLLPGAETLASKKHHTRANATNRAHVRPLSDFEVADDTVAAEFLFDPQTSGGLLIAVKPDTVEPLLEQCRACGLDTATIVGEVQPRGDASLIVGR